MEPVQAPITLDDARLAIFRQHTQLAQLLDELEDHAKAVVRGDARGAGFDDALGVLHAQFVRHLEFKEALQTPSFFGNHSQQRARVDALLRDRAVFSDRCTLAHEAIALVHALREEMAEEDAKLRALT